MTETWMPDDQSCMVQIKRKPEGFDSRRNPGTKVKCCWGTDDTQCINDADVEFSMTSGFRVVRHVCEGCLPIILEEKKCKRRINMEIYGYPLISVWQIAYLIK